MSEISPFLIERFKARAEFAWLKGDLEQVMSEVSLVLESARGDDDPWLQGELALWMWRASGYRNA